MKIGLLVLSINEGSRTGYYNTQEIGLAKALDKLGHIVIVYKLVPVSVAFTQSAIEGTRNAVQCCCPSRQIGNHGLLRLRFLDTSLDALICFSDAQLAFPAVYRWARRCQVRLLPYIGVTQSHNANRAVQALMNLLTRRTLRLYRKCTCMVKTPTVGEQLRNRGISQIQVVPVGLDETLLKTDYDAVNRAELRRAYDYGDKDRILLFIGRMTEEKHPLEMLELVDELRKMIPETKLLMVGRGELSNLVAEEIQRRGLTEIVQRIEQVPNYEVWKLYRMADIYVNLNRNEIFGMAILEAMYYECKVVAWEAPGPAFIIEDGISGYLVYSENEMLDRLSGITIDDLGEKAHIRVAEHFMWEQSAKVAENNILAMR